MPLISQSLQGIGHIGHIRPARNYPLEGLVEEAPWAATASGYGATGAQKAQASRVTGWSWVILRTRLDFPTIHTNNLIISDRHIQSYQTLIQSDPINPIKWYPNIWFSTPSWDDDPNGRAYSWDFCWTQQADHFGEAFTEDGNGPQRNV